MITEIDTRCIVPGNNDRTQFPQAELEELAASIAEHGLIQPITVRALDAEDLYQIVAGERRFRAVKMLGWATIPAIAKDLTDEEAAAVMLAENVARQDLDPIDEALAYYHRINAYGWSVQDCATRAGVSEIRIRFRLKLLSLRPDVQKLIRDGHLTIGYAQILSDAGLDANRQLFAVARLRDNPHPTPGWFRHEVNALLAEQAQATMFDAPLFGGPVLLVVDAQPVEPPHPSTTLPPKVGKSAREVISNQVGFWQAAADAWSEIGKPFKRQECQAAAQALQAALFTL